MAEDAGLSRVLRESMKRQTNAPGRLRTAQAVQRLRCALRASGDSRAASGVHGRGRRLSSRPTSAVDQARAGSVARARFQHTAGLGVTGVMEFLRKLLDLILHVGQQEKWKALIDYVGHPTLYVVLFVII